MKEGRRKNEKRERIARRLCREECRKKDEKERRGKMMK